MCLALVLLSAIAMTSSSNIIYTYKSTLKAGVMVERYKRFLADIDFFPHPSPTPPASLPTSQGSIAASALQSRFGLGSRHFETVKESPDQRSLTTVHCPNTGSMYTLVKPLNVDPLVYCSEVQGKTERKYKHTLEMIQIASGSSSTGKTWVGVHSALANKMVESALNLGLIEGMTGFWKLTRECDVKSDNIPGPPGEEADEGRIDFELVWCRDPSGAEVPKNTDAKKRKRGSGKPVPEVVRSVYIEVKSVTLAVGSSAQFPDWHMRLLMNAVTAGKEAAVLFLIQRDDCTSFSASAEFDPEYARLLHEAAVKGVQILPYSVRLDPEQGVVKLMGKIPFVDTLKDV